MPNDTSLLQAARKLQPQALAAIFDLYASAIFKYSLRLCGDPIEADNVVGDVFARLLDQLAAGKGPRTNLRAYLYQIAYHVVVDHAREMHQVVPLEGIWDRQDGNLSIAGAIEDKALLDAVLSSINLDLTPDQRHVVILRFIEDFSPQETANILDKTVDNVKVIQSRAIAKLRQVLSQHSDEDK
jgi:RNA polymerase sigma-70 factor (ECF subfamily)